MTFNRLSRLGATMLACALAACSAGHNGPTITSDRESLTMVGLNNSALAGNPVALKFTLPGAVGPDPTYYGLALSDSNQFNAIFTPGTASGTVTIAPVGPLPPGISKGNITLDVCTDKYCGHIVASRTIPYTVAVYALDTTALAMSATSGGSSQMRLGIVPADTNGQLVFTSSNTQFLTTDHSDASSLLITASGENVADGAYSGTIDIGYMLDGKAHGGLSSIAVSVTVGAGAGGGGGGGGSGGSTTASAPETEAAAASTGASREAQAIAVGTGSEPQ
jgi:hypothetical protein